MKIGFFVYICKISTKNDISLNISRTMKEITKPSKMYCVLAFLLVACLFPALAADFEVDGICYNVINENEVEVTSPDSVKYAGEVLIPSTVVNAGTTYRVTRIGNKAFYSCKDLTVVDIPEGVTSIGDNAFAGCGKLVCSVNDGSYAQQYCEENGIPYEIRQGE